MCADAKYGIDGGIIGFKPEALVWRKNALKNYTKNDYTINEKPNRKHTQEKHWVIENCKIINLEV